MKSVLIFVFSTCVLCFGNVQAKSETSQLAHALPEYSQVYDDQRDPFKDANAALVLAKATNRNVLIEIGGNWCTWCHKMDTFLLKNPNIYQALHSKYVLLKINVSDSNENTAFMKSLPPVLGYPHMYVSTANGKMLLSKDTAELQDKHGYSKDYWLAFLSQWEAKNSVGN
jgi:thiol:disulfide interchange protein